MTRARHDIHYDNGLTRIADPIPDCWIKDTSKIMECHDSVLQIMRLGNFWAVWPCFAFPHAWVGLSATNIGYGYTRVVSRCRRCGSQVHADATVALPKRGSDIRSF